MTSTAKVAPMAEHGYTLMHLLAAAGVRDDLRFAREIEIDPAMHPKPHQVRGLNQALTQPNDRFGLYWETGTMKTLVAQALSLYHAGLGNKVVVVMPPILLHQYAESLAGTFIGYERFFSLHVLKEDPAGRDALFERFARDGWPDFLLMTYQTFSKVPRKGRIKDPADPERKRWITTEPRQQDFISRVLKEAGYNVLICDEAHALKNYSSDTTKVVRFFLGPRESDVALLLMTGTPAHNTLLDTYSLIKLVTPDRYSSKKSFERLHCIYTTDDNGWSRLIGFQNKDILHMNLYAQAARVTKDKVLSLKDPHVIQVPIDLDPAHHRLYKKLVRERMLEVKGELIDAVSQQSLREKCLQIVTTPQHFCDQKMPNAVLDATDELLDSIGVEQEKVVLFATHQRTIEMLAEHYRQYSPVTVYGGNGGGEANRRNIEVFKRDPACRLAIMHPNSGGVGLNLQDVCRYMIFVEPISVPGQWKQACDRIHRGEIKHVVTFYILTVRGTLGPAMIRNMLSKERDILYVTRDRKSVLAELLDEA